MTTLLNSLSTVAPVGTRVAYSSVTMTDLLHPGDEGVIVDNTGVSDWSTYKIVMDNPRNQSLTTPRNGSPAYHWSDGGSVFSLVETPVEESDPLQAFRLKVAREMRSTAAARLGDNSRYVDQFLRDDLGLGDVLDILDGVTAPAEHRYVVVFEVTAPVGEQDALVEWVTAANPGATNVVVSYPGDDE